MWFELDPDNLDNFDFHQFLGALLADHQMFVLRLAPNDDGTAAMQKNEILFALSLLIRGLNPEDIVISSTLEVKPGFRAYRDSTTLFSNNPRYAFLRQFWDSIVQNFIDNNVQYGLNRFDDIDDWRTACLNAGVPRGL